MREIVRSFCSTFFRVIAIGLGIFVLFVVLGIVISSRSTVPHETTLDILPNHEWNIAPFSPHTPTILKISINGIIGLDRLTKQDVAAQLIDSINFQLKEHQVKAILLAINSPGGTVDDADSIYRMLLEYKKRENVPIYAYASGLCASGGMYVACAADKIFGAPDSIVGHVGVIMPTFFNFSDAMHKIGIQSLTIFSGKGKDDMNPFRPWRPDESREYQNITNSIYKRFLKIVSTHRPLLTEKSLIEQGAQVYPAAQAEELGYIDGIKNSEDEVLLLLATKAGIANNYQFVELKTGGFLADLFQANTSLLSKGRVEHVVRIPGALHPDLYGKPLVLWHPEAA